MTIFGLTEKQIKKQSGKKGYDVDPQCNDKPIGTGRTWEAAIRGSKKILENSELTELMHNIYRGKSAY